MPIYRITAPNGVTYQTDGPPGATPEQVKAVILAAHPEAGRVSQDSPIRQPQQKTQEEEPGFGGDILRAPVRGLGALVESPGRLIKELPSVAYEAAKSANLPQYVASKVEQAIFGTDYLSGPKVERDAVAALQRGWNPVGEAVASPFEAAGQAISGSVAPRTTPSWAESKGFVGGLQSGLVGAVESAPTTVAGLATALATKSPAAAAAVMGGLSFPQSYGGIRERQEQLGTEDIGKATIGAAASAAFDALTGAGGKVANAAVRGELEKFLARGMVDAGKEVVKTGVSEAGTEMLQNVIEQVAAGVDPTTKQSMLETMEAGLIGAISGGFFGATVESMQAVKRGSLRKQLGSQRDGEQGLDEGSALRDAYLNLYRMEVGRAMRADPTLTRQQAVELVGGRADELLAAARRQTAGEADADTGVDDGQGAGTGVPPAGPTTPPGAVSGANTAPTAGGVGEPSVGVSPTTGSAPEGIPPLDLGDFAPAVQAIREAPNNKARKPLAMQLVSDVVQANPDLQGLSNNKYSQAANQMVLAAARNSIFDPVAIVRGVAPKVKTAPETPEAAATTAPTATELTPETYVDRYLAGEGRGATQADLELQQYAANFPKEIEAEFAKRAVPEATSPVNPTAADVPFTSVPEQTTEPVAEPTVTPTEPATNEVAPANVDTATNEELAARDHEVSSELVSPEEQEAPRITLRGNKQVGPADGVIDELYNKGMVNPLNDNEVIIEGGGIQGAPIDGGKTFWLKSLRAIEPGGGRRALERLTRLADETGTAIQLTPEPFESAAGKEMTPTELTEWYRGFGFEQDAGGDMVRPAAPVQQAVAEPEYTPQQIIDNFQSFATMAATDFGYDTGMFAEGARDIIQGREPLTEQQILDAQGPEALAAYKAGTQWGQERVADAQAASSSVDPNVMKEREALLAKIKAAPGKTIRQKIFGLMRKEADAALQGAKTPEDIINLLGLDETNPLLDEVTRGRAGINRERMLSMLRNQYKSDPQEMAHVCVKEILQNSHDAVRDALRVGLITDGNIEFTVDPDGYTFTTLDNGLGMSPEILSGPFLEVGSTGKGGDGERHSGGYGLAKTLFLYGNEAIRVISAKDGVVSTLDTHGEQLGLAAVSGDPNDQPLIHSRPFTDADYEMFPQGHGTYLQLTLPKRDVDPETGEEVEVRPLDDFPNSYRLPGLVHSPLLSPVNVTYNQYTVPIGANFPLSDFAEFAKVKLPSGVAYVYASREPKMYPGSDNNVHILSDGVWQFSKGINKPNSYYEKIPHDFYINYIADPDVKPDNPLYPFTMDRKNFSSAGQIPYDQLAAILLRAYGMADLYKEATSFGTIQYFEPGTGQLGSVVDLTPEIPNVETGFEGLKSGSDIVLGSDGRVAINGENVDPASLGDMGKELPKASSLIIDQSKIDPDRVMVHENADVEYTDETGDTQRKPIMEFLRDTFGSRVDDFYYFMGDAFQQLRNEVAGIMNYPELKTEAVGVSVDPAYRGVSIKVPFSGMFINPLVPEAPAGPRALFGIITTMVHELAHFRVRNHDAGFPAEMQRIQSALEAAAFEQGFDFPGWKLRFVARAMDAGFVDIIRAGQQLFETEEDRESYTYGNPKYKNIRVVYRGQRFKDGASEQIPDTRGAGADGAQDDGVSGTGASAGEPLLGAAYEGRGGTGERGKRGAGPESTGPTDEELIAATKLTKAQINFALRAAGIERQQADNFQKKIVRSRNATEIGATISKLTKTTRSQKQGVSTLRALTETLTDNATKFSLVALGTDDITRWIGDRIKAVPRINKLIEDITVYRLDRIRQLSEDSDKWRAFSAEFEEGGRALGDIMHAATFYDVDPALAPSANEYMKRDPELQTLIKKGAKANEISRRKNEIRRVYNGATNDDGEIVYGWNDITKPELGGGKGKAIYRMARDAYRKTFNEHYDLLMQRIDDAEMEDDAAEQAKDFIERLFADARKKTVYFPLMRHGRFWLSVGKGKNSEFYLFESATARNKFKATRKAELATEGADPEMQQGDDIRQLRNNILQKDASSTLKSIFEMLNSGSVRDMDLLKDHIFQMYLQALPESDMRKRFTRRQYKTGFSTDTLRNFIVSQHTAANQLARLSHAYKLRNEISSGYSELKGRPNASRLRLFMDEMDKRARAEIEPEAPLDVMGIDFDKVLNAGNKIAFIWLLTSPKSALIQLTQLHVVGLPVLSAEFGEAQTYATAARYGLNLILGRQLSTTKRNKAGDITTQWGEPSIRDSKYLNSLKDSDPALYEAMVYGWNYANDRDMFMSTYAADMTSRGNVPSGEYGALNALQRGKVGSALWQGTKASIDFMSGAFHHMERLNRETMYMSTMELAYKQAIKQGKEPAAAKKIAAERAAKLTYEAMFNFSNYNKPRIAKFRSTRLATNFMTYSASMTSYLVRNFYGMLKSIPSKGGRKAAARKFFGTLGMTMMYAGVVGMPLFGLMMSLLDGLRSVWGDDGDDEFMRYADESGDPLGKMSTEYWFRTKFIPDTFGPGSSLASALGISDETAKVLASSVTKGPISALTGLDIGSSTSLNNLWFSNELRSEGEAALYEKVGRTLLGPTGSVLAKAPKALQLFEEGYGDRALETLLPAFLAGGVKATRFANEGVLTKDQKEVVPKDFFTFGVLFAQTAGFTNPKVAQLQQENFMLSEIERAFEDRKTKLIQRYNVAFGKDANNSTPSTRKALEDVGKDIDKFNANFPYTQITPETLSEAVMRTVAERASSVGGASINPAAPVGRNLIYERSE